MIISTSNGLQRLLFRIRNSILILKAGIYAKDCIYQRSFTAPLLTLPGNVFVCTHIRVLIIPIQGSGRRGTPQHKVHVKNWFRHHHQGRSHIRIPEHSNSNILLIQNTLGDDDDNHLFGRSKWINLRDVTFFLFCFPFLDFELSLYVMAG